MTQYQQYYQPPQPPIQDTSGKATGGLVLGLVGILAWIIPLIGLPVSIVGLVMSSKGMSSAKRLGPLAGMVLNIIFLTLTVINAAIGAYQGAHGTNWIQQIGHH